MCLQIVINESTVLIQCICFILQHNENQKLCLPTLHFRCVIDAPGATTDSSTKARSGLAAVKAAVRQSDDMFTDMFGEKCLVSYHYTLVKPHSLLIY